MRISVFGIGYVGAVTSACLAESGHEIFMFDTDQAKLEVIRSGRSPIIEKDLDVLIAHHVENGRLKIASSVSDAVMNSEISLICVGTPSREDGSLKLDYVRAVAEAIALAIKDKADYHCVVLRSTVVPGSARDVVLPILEKFSGKKSGQDFGFGNNPEFLREGAAVYDYFHPPKIVIGATNEKASAVIAALYSEIEAPRAVTSLEVAEGVKYADNAWHAMKIGFANEIGNVLKVHGVDSHAVMDIFCLDTKLNISKAYLKPGFAFGGSCLPKDLRALQAAAKAKSLTTPLFDALLYANDEQVRHALGMIEHAGVKNIALVGLAFKPGTDDLRESPLLRLAEILQEKNYNLKIYDPSLSEKYKNQKREGIFSLLMDDFAALFEECEAVIIGHNYPEFVEAAVSLQEDVVVIDLARTDEVIRSRHNYQGICW